MKICLENADAIMASYRPLILKTLERFSSFDRGDAEDLAGEAVLEAILNFDEERSNFPYFLKQSLNYRFLDFTKEKRPQSLDIDLPEGGSLVDFLESPVDFEEDLIKEEEVRDLLRALEALPPLDREILYGRYRENLSYKELGQRLGASPKTLQNRATLAKKILRERLSQS